MGLHGLCGLDVHRPSDIDKLVKEVLRECDEKVAVLERYADHSPAEVRKKRLAPLFSALQAFNGPV